MRWMVGVGPTGRGQGHGDKGRAGAVSENRLDAWDTMLLLVRLFGAPTRLGFQAGAVRIDELEGAPRGCDGEGGGS